MSLDAVAVGAAAVITADLRKGLYSAEEAGRDIAKALADAGLLYTPQERAIIDAAIAETAAEIAMNDATRAAAHRKTGSEPVKEYDAQVRTLTDAKTARRNAVNNLNATAADSGPSLADIITNPRYATPPGPRLK